MFHRTLIVTFVQLNNKTIIKVREMLPSMLVYNMTQLVKLSRTRGVQIASQFSYFE
jgi:hypothetical protein